MKTSSRVLVVDDEPKIVDVVMSYLLKDGFEVESAVTGREALEKFHGFAPALIILDLMLPDISGEELCRTIRQESKVPIIMLTAKVEDESVVQGLKLGADDYITKPFSPRQLMARVEAVLRRTEKDTANLWRFNQGELLIDSENHTVTRAGVPVSLTPNEFKILCALAGHPKKVYTRDELIFIVSGEDFEGFDRVIDTHIKNLRQKLETEPRSPKFILTVHGVGYRFGGMAE